MTNYGNTGQRYKMSKFAKVELQEDGQLLITLSCGHSFTNPHTWAGAQAMYQRFIAQGKRTRCDDCVVETKRV